MFLSSTGGAQKKCRTFTAKKAQSAKKRCLHNGSPRCTVTETIYYLKKEGKLNGEKVIVHNRGGILTVQVESAGDAITAIYLEGPTEVVDILDVK